MVQGGQFASTSTQRVRTQAKALFTDNPRTLQIAGLVAVAGITGAVGGVLVVKSLVAGKGATAANLALLAKGGAATKAGAASLPSLLASHGAGSVGAVTSNSASTGTAIPGITAALNNAATTGSTLAEMINTLYSTITTNALPLTAGMVGGGAAGVGLTQRQVRKVQEQLNEQLVQTQTLQAETAQLQGAFHSTNHTLDMMQAHLEQSIASPTSAPSLPPSQPPSPAIVTSASQSENLEQIHGIGPVFAQRLHAAGIHTLADLAAQTPERLEPIIDSTKAGALFAPQAWIDEARQLIGSHPNDLMLNSENVTPNVPVNTVDSSNAPQTAVLMFDRLEAIAGISTTIAARLNRAGILTYADLASRRPDQLAALVGQDLPQEPEAFAHWIQTARLLAE